MTQRQAGSVDAKPASTARILGASLAGTAVEFYDFYIYATAASLVFGALFFPSESASAQLMLAYASFGVAFIARPVGAFVFGHFGDRLGRKSTLVASLVLMGGSTILIGTLPGYAAWGWVAPALLCLLRFGQGFGLGGEWGGAALLAVENAPPGWKARYGMFPQLGAPVGFIASNGMFLVLASFLSSEDFVSWGWRIPFFASILLVGIGLWVRLKVDETPEFKAVKASAPEKMPVIAVMRNHAKELVCGTLAVIACFAIFYITTAFALGYATSTQGMDREQFLALQMGAILFMALGIIVSGYASDKYTPRLVLTIGCFGTALTGILIGPMMSPADPMLTFLFLSLALFVMGLVYGPLGGWLPTLFPAKVRYTGISIAFNAGGILGGATAPLCAQYLANVGGLAYVGFYLAAAGALSLIGILVLGQRAYQTSDSVVIAG